MGTISIGIKTKPTRKISTHFWHDTRKEQRYVAVDNAKAVIYSIEEFCNNYTDEEKGGKELENYKKYGYKYVIDSRYFAFGTTKKEARENLIN